MRYKTAILLVNYNTPENILRDCLDSLNNKEVLKDNKVIIVDNKSKNQQVLKKLQKEHSFVEFIYNKENKGFGGGNNIGIAYALKKYSPEFFYFLNTDTRVKRDFLTKAVNCMRKDRLVAIVGSCQKNFSDELYPSSANIGIFKTKYNREFDKEKYVNWVSGSGFLMRAEVLKEVGVFDEIYNPAYYEETDLERRCLKKGYKILFCPQSMIWHKGGGSTDFQSDAMFFIYHRNGMIYFLRHHSLSFFSVRFLRDIYKACKQGRIRLLFRAYREAVKLIKTAKKKE